MKLPTLSLVMTLYMTADPNIRGPRHECAKQTLMTWARYLHYGGEVQVVIANDTRPELEQREEWGRDLDAYHPWQTIQVLTHGAGIGGALNGAFDVAFKDGPLALYADDSYQLRDHLDVTPWARVLLGTGIGGISLMPPRGGLRGGAPHEHLAGSTAYIRTLEFERYGYVWCGYPMLYHQRLMEHYGPMPAGVDGFTWERAIADKYNEDPTGPPIHHASYNPWLHIAQAELGDKPAGWKA